MITPPPAIRRTRIVLWGESLGTGVAVAVAAEKPVSRVILQSPFTSTADIAAARYWFVPVRLLMKDQFHSDLRIAKVTAPVAGDARRPSTASCRSRSANGCTN